MFSSVESGNAVYKSIIYVSGCTKIKKDRTAANFITTVLWMDTQARDPSGALVSL